METLPDFIRVRLRQLAHDKLPPRRLLAVLRVRGAVHVTGVFVLPRQ
jgi:hypothetical protein